MADEVTKVDYYTAAIPNKPGEGARVLAALKEAGVNLTGLLGYRKSAKVSEVVFIVDPAVKGLSQTARKAGLTVGKKQKAFFINGEDRVGAVAEHLAALAAARINVFTGHALCAGGGRYGAIVVVDAKDMNKAAKALGIKPRK